MINTQQCLLLWVTTGMMALGTAAALTDGALIQISRPSWVQCVTCLPETRCLRFVDWCTQACQYVCVCVHVFVSECL